MDTAYLYSVNDIYASIYKHRFFIEYLSSFLCLA